jgi:hypothetical protein
VGVGLYFGGGSFAVVLFNTVFGDMNLSGVTASVIGILLLGLAGYGVLKASSGQNFGSRAPGEDENIKNS